MNESFSKRYRLLTSKQFQSVYRPETGYPRKFFSDDFLIIAIPNHLSWSRLGIVIKKKNVKLAVKRNTIKRIVRESFRTYPNIVNGSLDLIVIAHKYLPKKALSIYLDQQWKNILKYYRKS